MFGSLIVAIIAVTKKK
ncbi:hypothetical protein [Bacillus litorisediminis]|nr:MULTISPECIES: hypothetical protein [Bacillus]